MGNFAENLNLGNRFRPPLTPMVQKYTNREIIFHDEKLLIKPYSLVK